MLLVTLVKKKPTTKKKQQQKRNLLKFIETLDNAHTYKKKKKQPSNCPSMLQVHCHNFMNSQLFRGKKVHVHSLYSSQRSSFRRYSGQEKKECKVWAPRLLRRYWSEKSQTWNSSEPDLVLWKRTWMVTLANGGHRRNTSLSIRKETIKN